MHNGTHTYIWTYILYRSFCDSWCVCVCWSVVSWQRLLDYRFHNKILSQAGHEARWLHIVLVVIEQMAGSMHSQLLYYVIIQMDGQLAGLM